MPAEISNIILFFVFEFLVLFTSIRIIYLITKNNKKNYSEIQLVVGWISVSLIITSIIPTIFSFLKYNGIWQYFAIIILICIILHFNKKSELINYKNFLLLKFNNIFNFLSNWKFLISIGIIIPFILVRIAPVGLPDDLYILNFIFDWMFNNANPYWMAFHYVPVWELSFLPSMVISSSDNFLWLNSFKALIIIGLGTFLIGKSINLPKFLIWASVFSSILYFQFWVDGYFLGSIKNDYIFAAGFILMIFTLVRTTQVKPDRLCIIFFIVSMVFLTTKYSGVLLSIIAILFFIIINRNIISQNKKNIIIVVAIVGLVFLGTTGNYYLQNYLRYDNPFYPGQLNFLGIELPGYVDWSNTSILSKINNEKLFSIFFPTTDISKGGILFPITIIFGFLGTSAVIIYELIKFVKRKRIQTSMIVIASFLLITWILYLATPFSASQPGGNLYLGLESTRYIFGSIFVTELFFVGILYKLKLKSIAIFSIIAINAISRYLIVVNTTQILIGINKIQNYFDFSILIIIIPFILLLSLFIIGKKITKFSTRMATLILITFVIFVFAPQIVEENRTFWIPNVQNVAFSVQNLPPSQIFLIDEPGDLSPRTYRAIFIQGDHFQHSIIKGSREKLFSILTDENEINTIPKYVAAFCVPGSLCDDSMTKLKVDLEKNGYKEMARDQYAIILKFTK